MVGPHDCEVTHGIAKFPVSFLQNQWRSLQEIKVSRLRPLAYSPHLMTHLGLLEMALLSDGHVMSPFMTTSLTGSNSSPNYHCNPRTALPYFVLSEDLESGSF